MILATNIAETSLTVPGVAAVVDTGLVKIARYDADRGLDALVTERVTRDSADQRAGRAARLGPGVARRLWDARDRLRPSREPDIARIDLAGARARRAGLGRRRRFAFEWFEAPPADALGCRAGAAATAWRRGERRREAGDHARSGASCSGCRSTCASRASSSRAAARPKSPPRAPCSPKGGTPRRGRRRTTAATSCDLLADLDHFTRQPPHVRRLADELGRLARGISPAPSGRCPRDALRRALFAGYADRLARRRPGGQGKLLLASGHGAVLGRESGVRDGEFLVALDVTAAARDGVTEARIRAASRVEPHWITPTSVAVEHRLDAATGRVMASRVARADALVLSATPVRRRRGLGGSAHRPRRGWRGRPATPTPSCSVA